MTHTALPCQCPLCTSTRTLPGRCPSCCWHISQGHHPDCAERTRP